MLVGVLWLSEGQILVSFHKPNKCKLPFVVFCQVFGVGGTDVLTKCNAKIDFLLCEDKNNF